MPDYQITDNLTGRTITVRGDSAPTQAEAAALFASLPPAEKSVGGFVENIGTDVGGLLSALNPMHWPGILRQGAEGQRLAGEQFAADIAAGGGVGIDPGRWAAQGQQAVDALYEQPVSAALSVLPAIPGSGQAAAAGLRTAGRTAGRGTAATLDLLARHPGVVSTGTGGAGAVVGGLAGDASAAMLGAEFGRRAGPAVAGGLGRMAQRIRPRAAAAAPEAPVTRSPLLDRMMADVLARRAQANPEFWAPEGPRLRPQEPPGAPPGLPTPEGPIGAPGAAGAVPEAIPAPPPQPPPPMPPVVAPPAGVPPPPPLPPAGIRLDPTGPIPAPGPEFPPIPPRTIPPRPAPPPPPGPGGGLAEQQLLRLQTEHMALQAEAAKMADVIGYIIDNKVSPAWMEQVNMGEFGHLGFRDLLSGARELAAETGNPALVERLSRLSQRLRQSEVTLGRPRSPKKKKGS